MGIVKMENKKRIEEKIKSKRVEERNRTEVH